MSAAGGEYDNDPELKRMVAQTELLENVSIHFFQKFVQKIYVFFYLGYNVSLSQEGNVRLKNGF